LFTDCGSGLLSAAGVNFLSPQPAMNCIRFSLLCKRCLNPSLFMQLKKPWLRRESKTLELRDMNKSGRKRKSCWEERTSSNSAMRLPV
jgi:hypothetical protein